MIDLSTDPREWQSDPHGSPGDLKKLADDLKNSTDDVNELTHVPIVGGGVI